MKTGKHTFTHLKQTHKHNLHPPSCLMTSAVFSFIILESSITSSSMLASEWLMGGQRDKLTNRLSKGDRNEEEETAATSEEAD